tara:strand:+ start:1988 stop:3253 length:1266 start_codon:yes stop_codon:yes gene_type:complete
MPKVRRCVPESVPRLLHYVSLDGAGGVEFQFVDFVARARALAGWRSDIVACGQRTHPLIQDRLDPSVRLRREKYAGRLKLPKWPPQLRAACQRRYVRESRPDAVLIWNRLRDSEDTLAAAGPQRCIYWERGAAWFTGESASKRRFLDGVQAVLCNSHAARRMLELRWGYQGQLCVVPNALRPALMPQAPAARSGCADAPTWRLGVAARLESIKGVALAIHALASMRDGGISAELHIAGDGPQRDSLMRLAKRLGVARQVTFLGLVADMAVFYSGIDLLVHAALREPFGQIVIEAAAYGVPSVVAGVDGLVEVTSDRETGDVVWPQADLAAYAALGADAEGLPPWVYHPNEDTIAAPRIVAPEILAKAIIDLLADNPRYARYSAAGIERVATSFSFDTHVKRALTAVGRFVEGRSLTWEGAS